MNKELIAMELTKLYINNQDYIKTEQQILNIFLSFYNSLCEAQKQAEEKISTKMLCELGYIKYYHSSNEIIFIKKDEDYIVNIIHFDLIHKTILKYKTQFDTTNQEELQALLKAEKELGWEE